MIYRQLGDSGVKVSAVTMGAWAIGGWLWGGSDHRQAQENAAAADIALSAEEMARIDRLVEGLKLEL